MEHIIYRNAENGYSVLNLMADENEITVVGVFSYIGEGELVELEGDYTEHPMYGQQFKAERFEVKTPKDALAMERYLASGAVKGVGAALAARIVRRFGAKTFEIMEREPERLSEVKGISDRKAREIAEPDGRKTGSSGRYGLFTGVWHFHEFGCEDLPTVRTGDLSYNKGESVPIGGRYRGRRLPDSG